MTPGQSVPPPHANARQAQYQSRCTCLCPEQNTSPYSVFWFVMSQFGVQAGLFMMHATEFPPRLQAQRAPPHPPRQHCCITGESRSHNRRTYTLPGCKSSSSTATVVSNALSPAKVKMSHREEQHVVTTYASVTLDVGCRAAGEISAPGDKGAICDRCSLCSAGVQWWPPLRRPAPAHHRC